ncbi:uncharacterized protein KY384_004587 [Bacidia gigantensis]|uniref:uncharacterized protein n=1 Tax=Bacidia gigantensis TaxID=2732470 RepID=UPI001D042666|nr:uncharacterized protein KY384_004587 [Bacidia gigantensis]KAG8531229.1 hypothetical protein KY384_004587 [Bacidia gigantensis]
MLKVAHPASLRDGPHAEAKGALIVNEEDWPDPTGRTLANIYPQIRRELGINAGASSNGDHDRRTRVAIFALVKLHIVLQQPPSSVRSLSHGIKILSAAHACALAAFDLPSTQVAPTLWTLHFIVLEQSMNELRALERFLSSSPGHDGSPLIYAFDLSDPTDDILDALIATMSPEEPNSLSQKGLHNSSQAQEGIVEPDTITLPDPSVPHAINTKVDTAQYSADAISAYSHDKEVPTDKPMILRVAQHDPKKLLKDLRWSQARVRIFALNEDRHTRYRIVFEREGCLTTYDVTPHTDRLVLGYAFNIQPSAIWFLKDEKPNYCFASCNAGKDGLHEDLLTFQADLMAPIIPIHFPFVSSVAFQDGHTTRPHLLRQPINEEIAIKSETVATDIVIGNRSRKKKLSIYRLCMEDNQLPGLVVDSNHSDRPQSIAKLKLSCSTVNISFPNKRSKCLS